MEKISIIIPVYNGADKLERCLESIIKQDYRDIEIIVVDDGSKDDSFKIMKEYADKDDRIIALHKENGGVSSTRNKALDIATGDYVQFVDVDDWLPFDSSKLMLRAMIENDVDMVAGDFYRVTGENTSRKSHFKNSRLLSRNEYADKMMLAPADFYYGVLWNKLYKKSIIDEYHIRMDENINYSEDMIFNLEYLLHVNNIYILTAPVYYYHLSEGSLVAQNLNIQSAVKMKLEVIKYYTSFYSNILDTREYEQRKPIIYSFLFAFSRDAFNIPIVDSIRKLGEEGIGRIYLEKDEEKSNQFIYNYMSENVLKQLLNTVAGLHNLELNDVLILYYLYLRNDTVSFDEIVSVCNLNNTETAVALTKFTALKYIKIKDLNLFKDNKMKYQYVSGKLDDDLKQIDKDYENICFRDLDKDEIRNYKKLQSRILDNIRSTIVE